jgi:DNA-binding LytR/AlgR family response regulator
VEILERIMVKTRQKIKIIPVNDIVYLRSEGDYVMIISNDGKYLKEQTMKYFESHLPKSLFVRVHRSYIVNIEYISAIESYGKQNQQALLKNGEWLKVSLAGYKALKLALR